MARIATDSDPLRVTGRWAIEHEELEPAGPERSTSSVLSIAKYVVSNSRADVCVWWSNDGACIAIARELYELSTWYA